MGSARRSASRPTSCTRAGPSASKASPAASGSCWARARSAADRRRTMARALWKGALLADSADTIVVEGNHYFPPEALHREFFRESATHTVCGWKGTASYYDIVVGDAVNHDAAWYYPTTKEEAKNI